MGNIQTTANGQVQRGPKKEKAALQLLQEMTPEMARALPKHITPDRMARIVQTAIRANPKLAQCTAASLCGSILSAAQLGLEVNTPLGHAYLIPRQNRRAGTTECTLQIGYQGYMELARRSGQVGAVYAHEVRPGDKFQVKLGLSQDLIHEPSDDQDRESRNATHVYAVAKLKDGESVFVVLTRAQVEKYRARGGNGDAWKTDWEAMAKKTAVRRLATWIPKSAELAQAAAMDEAPEIGHSQAREWSPELTAALEAHGVEVPEDDEPVAHEAEVVEGDDLDDALS